MEREKAWNKIRESIPGTFYHIVHAKKLNNKVRLSKPVLQAQVNFTPYTELEKYNKELADLDELLETERELSKQKQDEFSKRWDLAYERQQLLNSAIEKFSVYHESCQKKIEKDIVRIRTTRAEIADQDREIRRLRKVLDKLQEVKTVIINRRDLCESFKDFMSRVVQSSGNEYANVQELIARFNDLKKIREETAAKTKKTLEDGVTAIAQQSREQQLFNDEELAYLVHKYRLEDYDDRLNTYNGVLNEKVILTQNQSQSSILGIERSKTSICCLYLNLCKEMNQKAVLKDTDVKGQLEFIQKFLGEMTKVTHKVRETLQGGSELAIVPNTFNPNRRHSCVNKIKKSGEQSTENARAESAKLLGELKEKNVNSEHC